MTPKTATRRLSHARIPGRLRQHAVGLASLFVAAASIAQPSLPTRQAEPDIDLYALMSGQCTTLKIEGRDFKCKIVAYFHSEKGRADFTVSTIPRTKTTCS
ncbi:MAG: hypothetical protein JO283_15630, partial [Bradyrhizobium sp.]|nr:hypothetical protein [Bradyrhizobium sp.]